VETFCGGREGQRLAAILERAKKRARLEKKKKKKCPRRSIGKLSGVEVKRRFLEKTRARKEKTKKEAPHGEVLGGQKTIGGFILEGKKCVWKKAGFARNKTGTKEGSF